ncbi:hypothetical protein [Clostridium cylindrosporum]|uniref:Uncharacterized protein n=1 Tax=Clostridium cylindrosporum DSM 605 TaxID=1121307 RepID=A0A0J8DES7_CLOCY|nr:hypothetical protein [Clostridium cylindrosporum]KMT22739.1 hypothetical protein CLCY_11c00730 [Clostridium cylindrosporum DSM 605]
MIPMYYASYHRTEKKSEKEEIDIIAPCSLIGKVYEVYKDKK